MKVLRVLLRDMETGKEGWVTDTYPDDYPDESIDFMWTDGNYACDCNRGDFLARALGEPEPEPALSCAGSRIAVMDATLNGQPFRIIAVGSPLPQEQG